MSATIDSRNSEVTCLQRQSVQTRSKRFARYFKRIESVAWELDKHSASPENNYVWISV